MTSGAMDMGRKKLKMLRGNISTDFRGLTECLFWVFITGENGGMVLE